jgi:hypothetical protein
MAYATSVELNRRAGMLSQDLKLVFLLTPPGRR